MRDALEGIFSCLEGQGMVSAACLPMALAPCGGQIWNVVCPCVREILGTDS